jgi:cell division protease FtsH
VDLQILARRTPGFSGADLANLVNEAALLAARRNKRAVTMDEMEEAIERVLAGPERKSRVISEREKKVIAFHESGHALVARLIPNTNPVHKVSIIPRGHAALGYTLQLPLEDRFLTMREELLGEIAVLLAGRSAEELVFKEISTGASNDLERATELAHKMVCEYGMSDAMGALTYGKKDREVFIGKDLLKERNYSEQTAREIDTEVRKIITTAYERAATVLKKNEAKLNKLATTLLEKEVLEGEEVDRILNIKTPTPK